MRRILILSLLVVALSPAWADETTAWAALRRGGAVVALMRHADAPGSGDPPGWRLDDCATQRNLSDQGSIYIGTEGVLYSPYIAPLVLLPADKFTGYKVPQQGGDNHYLQFVEACRYLDGKAMPPTEPERKRHEQHRWRC